MSAITGTARAPEILPPGEGEVRVAAALHPLKSERADVTVPAGLSIAEIFERVQPDPVLRRAAHVYVGEHYVPREHWHLVRPKPGALVSVRAFIAPRGGGQGGGGGKGILRSILMIAVAGAALFFGPTVGAFLGFSGPLAASVGQAVIGLGGMLLVNALIPPRTDTGGNQTESQTQFIEGARNQANPFGPVPVIFGKRRVVPQLAAEAYTEVVGDHQYLRMLFCWGVGPLSITDLRIGETSLDEFEDVEIQHREGYAGDDPITLYPDQVDQQNFSIALTQDDGWVTRTSAANADEIGVDLTFTSGLSQIDDDGNRQSRTVKVQIQYSVADADDWQSLPVDGLVKTFSLGWTNSDGTAFDQVSFTDKRSSAVRHGLTFRVPARGKYDVRIRRLTGDTNNDRIFDELYWTALRRITNESPIKSAVPVAVTALRIRATDQLNGVIDEFNGLATMKAKDWDGAAWQDDVETQSPASGFRHALQGSGVQVPYADAAIDLESLQYFAEFCKLKSFTYNRVHDFTQSLWDTLADIAAAGRGTPSYQDGKWGVIIDEPKLPVSHVTPRNSWGFTASKAFVDKPHAFRVQFNNENEDYKNDELRVYLDGHTAATASKFESKEYPGSTDPDQVTRHGRFDAAVAVHRPERWNYHQDMERMVYRRGDVVLVTHDVLVVGLAYGRIKSVQLDVDGNAVAMTADEMMTMEDGKSYGVSIRTVDDAALTAKVATVAGDTRTLAFATPIDAAGVPAAGDLFGFGILGAETDSALILSIEPSDDYAAQITAVPYREIVYDIDDGPIPAFETNLTPIEAVPDVQVIGVRSDESVLSVGPGESLSCQVAVKFVEPDSALDLSLQVQMRPAGAEQPPFKAAQVNAVAGSEVFLGNVRTGEYVDMRLRWVAAGRVVAGSWAYVSGHRVIGKSTAPDPLSNLSIQTFGGQAFLRWSQPTELDVVFGGTVHFRHSSDAAPEWNTSTSIGDVAQARSLVATLPLKPGTYLARVFDINGLSSTVVSIDTKQASVLAYADVDSVDQAPSFPGTHDNTAAPDGELKLSAEALFDDIPAIDDVDNLDTFGGLAAMGTYGFAGGFDFGVIKRVRLTSRLAAVIYAAADRIDAWEGLIDDRADFDGVDQALCDCEVQVSLTDDDPTGTPTWGPWQRLDSREVETRACRFQAVLTSESPDFNIVVSELGVDAEEVV